MSSRPVQSAARRHRRRLVMVLVITAGILGAEVLGAVLPNIASVVIGLLILPRIWRLLREAVDVLLEATPKGVDLSEVRAMSWRPPGVADVHDLHVWDITSGMNVVSAHVVTDGTAAPAEILDRLWRCMAGDFDIEYSTFQIEPHDRRPQERPATHDRVTPIRPFDDGPRRDRGQGKESMCRERAPGTSPGSELGRPSVLDAPSWSAEICRCRLTSLILPTRASGFARTSGSPSASVKEAPTRGPRRDSTCTGLRWPISAHR